jgi:hypothetical protein
VEALRRLFLDWNRISFTTFVLSQLQLRDCFQQSKMRVVLSQSAYVLVVSSSITLATYRLLQWRARKRAKIAAEKVQGMVKPGPLVSWNAV